MPTELRGATLANAISVLDELCRLYVAGERIPHALYSFALNTRIDLALALPAVRVVDAVEVRHG